MLPQLSESDHEGDHYDSSPQAHKPAKDLCCETYKKIHKKTSLDLHSMLPIEKSVSENVKKNHPKSLLWESPHFYLGGTKRVSLSGMAIYIAPYGILSEYHARDRYTMDELEKLSKLLQHWMEHNDEHAEAYLDWSKKASSLGNKDLSSILKQISIETKKLNELFIKAIKAL
jgi:hypothetical protein